MSDLTFAQKDRNQNETGHSDHSDQRSTVCIPQTPETPAKSEEGRKSKFFRAACTGTIDQIASMCDKTRLAELYAPVLKLKPRMVDRLHATLIKVITDQFQDGIASLIVDDELDQMFKLLEQRVQEKNVSRKKSIAWRPTGQTPQQQLVAHDVEKKAQVAAQLREAVAAKQERVQQLRAQLEASRASARHLEQLTCKLQGHTSEQFQLARTLSDNVHNHLEHN